MVVDDNATHPHIITSMHCAMYLSTEIAPASLLQVLGHVPQPTAWYVKKGHRARVHTTRG